MCELERIKGSIIREVERILGKNNLVSLSDIAYPPDRKMGDLSLPCFGVARKTGDDPKEISERLKGEMNVSEICERMETAGPYLNFFLNKEHLASAIIAEISSQKEKYGQNKKKNKKKIMVEYSNVNTHKEYHVGHLRNICYGETVTRMIKAQGDDAIPVSYVNDFGIHTAKTIWWTFHPDNPEKNKIKNGTDEERGYILGKMYAEAVKKIETYPKAKDEVSSIMRGVESRKGEGYEKWEKTREWSIRQFDRIYKELGINFHHFFYENEFIEKGRKKVEELLEKGILKKSQGAIIADLEEKDLGVLVIIRSDGTSMYAVADLALGEYKIEKYKLDESIYVVDNRQSLYFKQLFQILSLMDNKSQMTHLAYDFVKLPGGMMSSRTGNVITYEELKKKMTEKAKKETKKRHKDWENEKINKNAKKLALNTIKFEMLKVKADNIINFDIDRALSFEGFTAAYILYTGARIQSIIRKSKGIKKTKKGNIKNLKEEEHELIMKISKYPDITGIARENHNPSEIAKYLNELCQIFNDYYHKVPILQADNKDQTSERLMLAGAISQVIENGLEIMNIEPLDEM